MSNMTSASGEASASISSDNYTSPAKRKRNLPGNPDPDAEVIALSPNSLMATNRFVCQVCNKGFQRDQNLQLHRRGHNLPWKLRQRSGKESTKRVYICPETSCVHHNPSRALGDLTGIKKHFSRKHGEKKWKCDKCSKTYAVQSDWKAHSKTCGTREYRCDCGTLFSRRDSFITHRAFCDALAQEKATMNSSSPLGINPNISSDHSNPMDGFHPSQQQPKPSDLYDDTASLQIPSLAGLWPFTSSSSMGSLYSSLFGSGSSGVQGNVNAMDLSSGMVGATNWPFPSNGGSEMSRSLPSMYAHHNNCSETSTANMSATALLQKAAQMNVKPTINSSIFSASMERREGEKMSSAFVSSQMDNEKGNAGLLDMMKSCVGLGSFNAVQQGYNTLQTSIGENNAAASYGGFLESLAPSRNMNIGPPPSLPQHQHKTMLMQVENQKSNVKASAEVECEGVTRDFLGVGMRVVLNMGTQYRNMLE